MTVPANGDRTADPTCNNCGHRASVHRIASPDPVCTSCPDSICTTQARPEPTETAPAEHVWRCVLCGDTRTTLREYAPGTTIACHRVITTERADGEPVRCGGHYELDTTPPVPIGWYRDAPARGQRERFVDTVCGSVDFTTGEAAWRLILDAWRVVEVASARASRPATPNREEWFAALQVAVFRAEHPEATSTSLDEPC